MKLTVELLKEKGALLEGHFLLSSGLHSDKYVQCAKLFTDTALTLELGKSLAQKILSKYKELDLIVSPALGGLLIGFSTALALNVPFIFTERVNGTMTLRRGFEVKKHSRVVIVEDVITTAKSASEVARIVEKRGGEVKGIASVIKRGENGLFPTFPFLLDITIANWRPQQCPLCKKGIPIVYHGSKKLP